MSENEIEERRTITIRFEFGRRQLVAMLSLALLVLTPGDLVTEQLTLTTYYPSPYGVYEELRATQNTYLSYIGGNTCVGSTSCGAKLSVSGAATVSGNTTVGGQIQVSGHFVDGGGQRLRDSGGGWVRTYGATGWYNGTYGGGWRMQDGTWLRTYGNKSIYQNAGTLRTDGNFQVGPAGSGSQRLYVAQNGEVRIGSGSGSKMRILTNGRVGINVTSPTEILDVNGDFRLRGEIVRACKWYSYGVGSRRYCPSRWSVFAASDGGGRMTGGVPGSGRMLCCRFTEY